MKRLLLLILFFCTALPLAAVQYGEGADIEPPASAMVSDGNTLYMTFCGKMHDVSRSEICKDPVKGFFIADIGFFKMEPGIGGYFRKGFQISGISQFIHNTYTVGSVFDQVPYNSRPDKTSSAGNKETITVRHEYLISSLCAGKYAGSLIYLQYDLLS